MRPGKKSAKWDLFLVFFLRQGPVAQPAAGEIVEGRCGKAHGPAHAEAVVHIGRTEPGGDEIDRRDPQQNQGQNGVHHGEHALPRSPHGVVEGEEHGEEHVERHDAPQIRRARIDDCGGLGENGDEEAKELLESHQSFIQRMKSNDKEAAFKKWKEEYYGRTKKQTT